MIHTIQCRKRELQQITNLVGILYAYAIPSHLSVQIDQQPQYGYLIKLLSKANPNMASSNWRGMLYEQSEKNNVGFRF